MRFGFGTVVGLVPFGALWLCQGAMASRLADEIATRTSAVLGPVSSLARARADYDPFSWSKVASEPRAFEVTSDGERSAADEDDDVDAAGVMGPGRSKGALARATAKNSSARGGLPSIRVPADVVLRLALSGHRPEGKPVARRGNRPAGIQVVGASSLGIGIRDGDVLTEVAGVPVTSVGQVVALVIAARGARKPTIEGRLWRGQRSYVIQVEQPYPDAPDNSKPSSLIACSGPEAYSGEGPSCSP